MTNKKSKIAVVIPVYNRRQRTLDCLTFLSCANKTGIDLKIIVVDDGSTDGTSSAIARDYPETIVLRGDGNLWWSGAANQGVKYALEGDAEYILILNDDVEFSENLLSGMLKTAKNFTDKIVCGIVCDEKSKKKIIAAGRFSNGFLHYNYAGYLAGADISVLPKNEYESEAESGYALFVPRIVFEKVGLFDAKIFPHNMGDMDFVLRARKGGFKVIINPTVFIYTKVGSNYFHSFIVDRSLAENLKMFTNIKSTVCLRTRWNFCIRYTRWGLGCVSFAYFLLRMSSALIMKFFLPNQILSNIMRKRVKRE